MLRILSLLLLSFCVVCEASAMTWPEIKAELEVQKKQFLNKQLSEVEKVRLLPKTNQLFSQMQMLEYSPAQNAERITYVVEVLAAARSWDAAFSTTDTTYMDFKKHRALYLAAFKRQGSQMEKKLIEAFDVWKSFESEIDSPEITGKPRK